MRGSRVFALALGVLLVAPGSAVTAAGGLAGDGLAARSHAPPGVRSGDFRDGVVLVGFRAGTSAEAQRAALARANAREVRRLRSGARIARVPKGRVQAAIATLKRQGAVRYAEPDYIYRLERTPDDPSYDRLWGLENEGQQVDGVSGTADADIDADLAWDTTTGSAAVVVGIVDTGVEYAHADLAANTWSNPGGIGGCAAGTHGYNAITRTCDPRDDHDHGTHVAGTIGAVGDNGTGVAGINWQTTMMALKAFDATGEATTSSIVAALDFAVDAHDAGVNLRVLNNSWGGYDFSQATLDAIRRAGDREILFVAAAGNYGFPNDMFPLYPCAYDAPNIVCVAATDQNDDIAFFSNYGTSTVDLGAPGVNVYSTVRGGYAYFDGTSMATPHVTGAAALVLALGDRTALEVKQRLLESVDRVPALADAVATGGRLNVANAAVAPSPLPGAPRLTVTPEAHSLNLTWTAPVSGASPIREYVIYRGTASGSATELGRTGADERSYTDSDVARGTTYHYQVSAVNSDGEGPRSEERSARLPGPPAAPSLTAMSGDGTIHLCWTPSDDGGSPITAFRVYRGDTSGGEALLTDGAGGRRYDDAGTPIGVDRYYQVTAVNGVGESPRSNEAAASAVASGSAPAISDVAPVIASGGSSITLTGERFAAGDCINEVWMGSVPASVTAASPSQLIVNSPAAGGSGPVTVRTPAGTVISTADFYAVPAPHQASDVAFTRRIAGGTSVDVALPASGKVGMVLFAGSAGSRVSMNVTNVTINASQVSILKPDGTALLPARRVITWGSFFDATTLPSSGTYTIVVDPEASYTGSMRLALYNVPPDATGSVSANGPAATVSTSVPGQNASMTFTGSAGQRVSLNVAPVTLSGSDLAILKPDGTTLVGSRFVNTSGTFFDATTLPATGTYRVTINPRDAATGSLTFRLYDVPADATASATIDAPATSLAIGVPGQNGSVSFAATAGQRVSVHVTGVTIGQSDLSITRPDGTTQAPARYVTTSGSFFDAMSLPASGAYRIVVNPRAAYTGNLSIRIYGVPPDAAATLDPAGPAATLSITVPGQNGTATFTGAAGSRVSMNVTGVTIGASDMSILKPDGSALVGSRYVGTSGTFFDAVTLPANGTYRLSVNPRDAVTGSATIRLYTVPPDATVGLSVGGASGTVSVTVPGQNAAATFAGTSGQAVSLVISGVTIGQSDVSIVKPDGTTLVAPQFVTTSGRTISATLPATGTYRVVINPRSTFTGSMTLRI